MLGSLFQVPLIRSNECDKTEDSSLGRCCLLLPSHVPLYHVLSCNQFNTLKTPRLISLDWFCPQVSLCFFHKKHKLINCYCISCLIVTWSTRELTLDHKDIHVIQNSLFHTYIWQKIQYAKHLNIMDCKQLFLAEKQKRKKLRRFCIFTDRRVVRIQSDTIQWQSKCQFTQLCFSELTF